MTTERFDAAKLERKIFNWQQPRKEQSIITSRLTIKSNQYTNIKGTKNNPGLKLQTWLALPQLELPGWELIALRKK